METQRRRTKGVSLSATEERRIDGLISAFGKSGRFRLNYRQTTRALWRMLYENRAAIQKVLQDQAPIKTARKADHRGQLALEKALCKIFTEAIREG